MADTGSRGEAEMFAEALGLPAAERAAYLARACGADVELRRRVEELLEAQAQLGDFLESPGADPGFDAAALARDGEAGMVGNYRLIERIGEGGCGVVFRAEQEQPIQRRVALKIIKPGMDTDDVIARFERERQALALMEHPGIAKVFDAGQTKSGRPYFVMELISGTKITEYCDQQRLTVCDRLKLFGQVCHAIQHAHQKGIIHRDIKPSNILVATSQDGAIQPVVIDFGVAKATGSVNLTDRTLFTAVDMLIGTPTYMSPEQTMVAQSDIDTRSDIYSLGVLLYELLTGTTPFDVGELSQLGLDELRRTIREREPLRPSVRLARLPRARLAEVARQRSTECPTLARDVRGDLDCIVLKALEKDRARRYETASGLAADVARFLGNEPITARPASAWYRFTKSIRRNQFAYAMVTAVFLLLVGGLAAITVALKDERLARRDAEAARQRAELARASEQRQLTAAREAATKSNQVTAFMRDLLRGAGPEIAKGRDSTVLRQIMADTKARIARELGNQPKVRGELYHTIARVNLELSLMGAAAEAYELALAAVREDPGPESAPAADNMTMYSFVLMQLKRFDEAERMAREGLRVARLHFGSDELQVVKPMIYLGEVLRGKDDDRLLPEAEQLYREAYNRLSPKRPPEDPFVVASLYGLAALIDRFEERSAEAERLFRDLYERTIRRDGTTALNAGSQLQQLAEAQQRQAKLSAAEAGFRAAMELTRTLQGPNHSRIAALLQNVGNVQMEQGRLHDAESTFKQVLEFGARLKGTREESLVFYAQRDLSKVRAALGDWPTAEILAREEFAAAPRLTSQGRESRVTATALGRLATALLANGKGAEADQLFAELASEEFLKKEVSGYFLRQRASYNARRGRWAPALADARASIAHQPGIVETYHILSALLVQARATSDYTTLTRTLVARFGHADNAVSGMRLAMSCLVLPPDGAELASIAPWVELITRTDVEGSWTAYGQSTKALYEYRRGDFTGALTWAERAASGVRPDVRAIASAVQALAHLRLGDRASSEAALARGAAFVADLSGLADLGGDWKERIHADTGPEWKASLIAQALVGEAHTLLRETPGLR
jgi:eukaryotic-like serine/threonine-protein kinase